MNHHSEVIELIAKDMIAYDKNHIKKTWRELAEVAYSACIRHYMTQMMKEVEDNG
jgi:hypothetical protein